MRTLLPSTLYTLHSTLSKVLTSNTVLIAIILGGLTLLGLMAWLGGGDTGEKAALARLTPTQQIGHHLDNFGFKLASITPGEADNPFIIEKIALDEYGFSALENVALEESKGALETVIIEKLTLAGEWRYGAPPVIDGLQLPIHYQPGLLPPIIQMKSVEIALNTPFGVIVLEGSGQIANGVPYFTLQTTQHQMAFRLEIAGRRTPEGYVQLDINLDNGRIDYDDVNLSRATASATLTHTANGTRFENATFVAGALRYKDVSLQNIDAQFGALESKASLLFFDEAHGKTYDVKLNTPTNRLLKDVDFLVLPLEKDDWAAQGTASIDLETLKITGALPQQTVHNKTLSGTFTLDMNAQPLTLSGPIEFLDEGALDLPPPFQTHTMAQQKKNILNQILPAAHQTQKTSQGDFSYMGSTMRLEAASPLTLNFENLDFQALSKKLNMRSFSASGKAKGVARFDNAGRLRRLTLEATQGGTLNFTPLVFYATDAGTQSKIQKLKSFKYSALRLSITNTGGPLKADLKVTGRAAGLSVADETIELPIDLAAAFALKELGFKLN